MDKKLFLMSKKFNMCAPEEFGLMPSHDPDIFMMPEDHSLWKKRSLYDFGWGPENGYYRLPLPDNLDGLIDIIMLSSYEENKYGAAAVILEDHCEELMSKCQQIFQHKEDIKYKRIFRILKLDDPINRSSVIGKSCEQIKEDHKQWIDIATRVKKLI